MKINSIIAISLAASSFSCLAFSSQPNVVAAGTTDNVRSLENQILSNFYSQHSTVLQKAIPGTCDASPVAGCSCPFCTMLRSSNR